MRAGGGYTHTTLIKGSVTPTGLPFSAIGPDCPAHHFGRTRRDNMRRYHHLVGLLCLLCGVIGVAWGVPNPYRGQDCVNDENGDCRKYTGSPSGGCCLIDDPVAPSPYLVFI